MVSRIPLFGLKHKTDVIRRTAADDGAGGVDDTGTEIVLYTDRKCRITTLDPNDEQMRDFGFRARQHRKVILVYSPKIQRNDEFLRLKWGIPPNVGTFEGAPDNAAPVYLVTHPAPGTETLTWDVALSRWQNSAATMRMEFTGGVWQFDDDINTLTVSQADLTSADQNPWPHHAWPWFGTVSAPATYSVVKAASSIDYKVVWHKHQYDDFVRKHHTSVVIELEDADTA